MRAWSSPSSSPSAVSTGPVLTIASTPRCGREPCAARPVTSTSCQTKPRCATTSAISVGSVTTAASARTLSRTSRTPRLSCSSSATAATTTSPARSSRAASRHAIERGRKPGLHVVRRRGRRGGRPRHEGRRARPSPRRSPCRYGRRGAASLPPPRPRARTTTLGRPGVDSRTSVSRPASFGPRSRRTRRSSARRRRRGTSAGLTESISTRRARNSVVSFGTPASCTERARVPRRRMRRRSWPSMTPRRRWSRIRPGAGGRRRVRGKDGVHLRQVASNIVTISSGPASEPGAVEGRRHA